MAVWLKSKEKRQHFLCTKYELYNGHVTIRNYITLDLFCDHLFRQGTRWSLSQHQQYTLSRHEICCRKSMFIAWNIKTLIFTRIWAFLTKMNLFYYPIYSVIWQIMPIKHNPKTFLHQNNETVEATVIVSFSQWYSYMHT